jgi:hypothetical protein
MLPAGGDRRRAADPLAPLQPYVELPLKAVIRGYSYGVVPNARYNRKIGLSKLRIPEMGSRYLSIILYVSSSVTCRGATTGADNGVLRPDPGSHAATIFVS